MKTTTFIENYFDNIKKLFRYYKSLGDRTFAQLSEQEVFHSADEYSNSIAVITKHISGNMISRFTDFLTSDGEKPWRNREMEFQNSFETKEQVLAYWEKGWACVFNAIDPLTIEEANKIVYIRNEGHSILEALNRQLGHYSYHIGQIVFLGKTLKGKDWQSLSIPVGQSTTFNSEKFGKEKSRKNFV
jgi:hypothetical protein